MVRVANTSQFPSPLVYSNAPCWPFLFSILTFSCSFSKMFDEIKRILKSTWQNRKIFHTDVPWGDAPAPFDFRTSLTTGVPPGGNFNLKFAGFISDDYLGKYLGNFYEISHRCSLRGYPSTSRFSDWSDNSGAPWWQF